MEQNNNLLTDPIEILMAEHEAGLSQLAELDKAILFIEANGFDDESISKIKIAISFINDEIRFHNEKEEIHLFPLLAKHVTGPTMVMEHEHRELWDAFTKLKILMEQNDKIYFELNKENIVNTSKFIIELLSSHIYKENNILFPMAKNSLTKEEYKICSDGIFKATNKN